ncbi:hypothetical protein ACIBVL_42800 [Streptomyces sp. NPDC049687]|uniref:hypothetical protein n=1 Tax=Streptomyces sp. NPDC049687 TaxID=3365596 RepID=UPI00379512D1
MLLTAIDLLSARYPGIDAHVDAAIRERQRAKPFSESVAAVLADWPAEQPPGSPPNSRRGDRSCRPNVVGALRTDPDA